MATNENLQQINTFTGGMNTDVSDSMLQNSLYREARNLRIVTDTESNTGELRLIEGGTSWYRDIESHSRVLAFTSCRDLGIIITKERDGDWHVLTFRDGDVNPTEILSCREEIGDTISVETVYESEENIKLYIADGIHPILIINCADTSQGEIDSLEPITNIANIPLLPITNIERIEGALKPALVQYSYLFYNQYGTSTRISPLSVPQTVDKKISGVTQGVEYDKLSNNGFSLTIPTVEGMGRLIIYRITYQQIGLLPTIDIIYNGGVISTYKDVNYNVKVASITPEAYNAYGNLTIIPKVIKAKDNLLFAGNVGYLSVDRTEYNAFVNWGKVLDTDVQNVFEDYLDDLYTLDIPSSVAQQWFGLTNRSYYGLYTPNWLILLNETESFVLDSGETSYLNSSEEVHKTLRSGEVYRYGIVLYHSDGSAHPVIWLGDLKIPNRYRYLYDDTNDVLTGSSTYVTVYVKNLPAECTGYEIVRCKRTEADRITISLGVLSAPAVPRNKETNNVLHPTGIIALNRIFNVDRFDTVYTNGNSYYSWDYDGNSYSSDNYPTNSSSIPEQLPINGNGDPLKKLPEIALRIQSETVVSDNLLFYSPEVSYQDGYIENIANEYKDNIYLECINQVIIPWANYSSNPHLLTLGGGTTNNSYSDYEEYRLTNDKLTPQFYRLRSVDNALSTDLSNSSFVQQIKDDIGTLRVKPSDSFCWVNSHYDLIEDNNLPEAAAQYITNKTNYSSLDDYSVAGTSIPRNEWSESLADRQLAVYIKLYNTASIPTGNHTTDISDIHVPKIPKFDDFANENNLFRWEDDITPIGSKNYNPWITHNLYGYERLKYETITDGGVLDVLPVKDYYSYVQSSVISDINQGTLDGVLKISESGGNRVEISGDQSDDYRPGIFGSRNRITRDFVFDTLGIGGKCAVLSGDFLNNSLLLSKWKPNYDQLGNDGIRSMIVNLKRKNVIPYGGNTQSSRDSSVYHSVGAYSINTNETLLHIDLINDGDCFVNCFEFITAHQQASANLKNHVNATIIYSIPVESDIDLLHTHGAEYSRLKRGANSSDYDSLLQTEPTEFLKYYTQTTPMYLYNTAYGSDADVKLFPAQTEESDYLDLQQYDNRIHYSNAKTANESIDSWTQFQSANFLDVDAKYGGVTHLDTFNGNLFFWQEDAFGLLPVHERVQIQDENNLGLMLGVGGVLDRYDYLSTLKGMKEGHFASTKSQAGLYWWDEERNELQVYRIGSAPTALSKEKNILNYLNERKSTSNVVDKPAMFFDPKYDEVLASMAENSSTPETTVFNESTNAYSSIYELGFVGGITINGNTYLATNYGNNAFNIVKWNTSNDEVSEYPRLNTVNELKPSLKYVINRQPMFVKTFDNQIFAGRFYGGSDIVDEDYTERPYYVIGEHDNTPLQDLEFEYSTPLKLHSSTNGAELSNREYDFRLAIPREDGAGDYGSRMRGKTMQCKLSSLSNSLDFSLQHIITKFRMSWS